MGLGAAARAINDRGEVVGTWFDANGISAFYWSKSTGMIDLGKFNGASTFATDINGNGEIVGYSFGSAPIQAFVTRVGGPFIPLANLAGGTSQANQINDCGRIVGGATDASGDVKAVVWSDGRVCR